MLNKIKISGSLRPHKTHKTFKIYSRNQNVNSNENLSPLFGHFGLSR